MTRPKDSVVPPCDQSGAGSVRHPAFGDRTRHIDAWGQMLAHVRGLIEQRVLRPGIGLAPERERTAPRLVDRLNSVNN